MFVMRFRIQLNDLRVNIIVMFIKIKTVEINNYKQIAVSLEIIGENRCY